MSARGEHRNVIINMEAWEAGAPMETELRWHTFTQWERYFNDHYLIVRLTPDLTQWTCPCGGTVDTSPPWTRYYGTHVTCPDCGTRYMLTGWFGDPLYVYVPLPPKLPDPLLTAIWKLTLTPALPSPKQVNTSSLIPTVML